MIDISELKNKEDNPGQAAASAEIPANQKLPASEFIEKIVKPIIELQQTTVRKVVRGAQAYTPVDGVITLPSEEASVSIVAQESTTSYVATGGSVKLHLRITSVNGGSDTGNVVTVEFQKYANSSYTTLQTESIPSRASGNTGFDEFDITSILADGENQIRVKATDPDTGAYSYLVFSSIVKASLSVECMMDWERPITDLTQGILLSYAIYGTGVSKTLNVRIYDNAQNSYREITKLIGTNTYPVSQPWTDSSGVVDSASDPVKVLTHGVHTIEAWVSCIADGVTFSSPHIKNQVMVVADPSNPKHYLMLQQVKGVDASINDGRFLEADNYVHTDEFFQYAIYEPNADSMKVEFSVDDASGNMNCLRLEQVANNNTKYRVPATIQVESASVGVTSYVYLTAVDANNENILSTKNNTKIIVAVNNNYDFAPTSGADFRINPSQRNNEESNPKRILNAAKNNAVVESSFVGFNFDNNDGWLQDADGSRILRVLAGQKLTVHYDPFAAFLQNPSSSVTIDMVVKIKNVTNEEDPIIDIANEVVSSGLFTGVKLKPLEGSVMTASQTTYGQQNFGWHEDTRTHISINICSAIYADPTSRKSIPLVRVFVNCDPVREFTFALEEGEWGNKPYYIQIGQNGADIDIYDFNVYTKALSATNIRQNFTSALPTIEAKLAFIIANDILAADGTISYEKAREKYSCIVHHGTPTSLKNPDATTGWLHIDHMVNGVYDKDSSGDICKQTKSIPIKGQGSTAKHYCDWNQQYDVKKAEGKITVDGSEVIDGWVDGNGVYKGAYYQLSPKNDNKAEKLVGKINYASCMQSHKMGAVNAYNDLYRLVMGDNLDTIMKEDSKARCSCKQDWFMFFVQEDGDAEPKFEGIMTFGPGKMDKKTWGYSSDKYPDFGMFEGSDNDQPITNFERPWNNDVAYDPSEEAYMYNGKANIDFDAGATVKDANDKDIPTGTAVDVIKAFINYGYLHCTDIKPWATNGGTATSLIAAGQTGTDIHSQYWVSVSDDNAARGDLYSWSPKAQTWVKAGINEETRNVFTENPSVVFSADLEATNEELINAIIVRFKASASEYFNVRSCLFHSCFVQNLLAGSDNCAKNTYYVTDPTRHNINFHADDLDTIFKTDNVGWQTKKYYVDRVHHIDDEGVETYSGTHNMFFNTFDRAYETEKAAMMKDIFEAMAILGGSAKGFFDKYFFNIQREIPAVAYLEQARIRYELRQIQVNEGEITLDTVDPITQQLGSQLESELQYMDRRLVYFQSYAAYGPFAVGGGGNNFGFRGYPKRDGTAAKISFTLQPHQYIYPTGAFGQSLINPHVRLSPRDTYELVLENACSSDTTCTLFGVDYYKSIGNIGELSVNPTYAISIGGKRLTKVEAIPTSGDGEFRPSQMSINATLISEINIRCTNVGSTLDLRSQTRLETIDLRDASFNRVNLPSTQTLTSVKLGRNIANLSITGVPNLQTLSLQSAQYLTDLIIGSGIPNINTLDLINFIFQQKLNGGQEMERLNMASVSWGSKAEGSGVTAALVRWVCGIENVSLFGTGNIVSDVNADLKQMMVAKFGNVDSTNNPIYLTYVVRNYTNAEIDGAVAIRKEGSYNYKLTFTPPTANNFVNIKWSISENNYAAINERTGVLTTIATPPVETEAQPVATIKATILFGDGRTDEITKVVYLYNRIPKVGDFAYANGDFDDVLYVNKTIVGWVFRVINNGDGTYKCLVQSTKDLNIVSTNGTAYTSIPWGIYSGNSYVPASLINEMASALGLNASQVTDLMALANVGSAGLRNEAGTAYNYNYVKDFSAYDDTQPDGFAIPDPAGAVSKWDGKADTESIIAHAKQFVQWALDNITLNNKSLIEYLGWSDYYPRNVKELGDLLVALKQANASADLRELAYPAAYGCKLYEPTADDLDEQYQAGNWYLPGAGELVRLYIFYRNSRAANPTDTGTPTAAFNDLDNPKSTEARRPWYANFMKKASDKGVVVPIMLPQQANYWSSSELNANFAWVVNFSNGVVYNLVKYNSYVVRPVAAFTFSL